VGIQSRANEDQDGHAEEDDSIVMTQTERPEGMPSAREKIKKTVET
jgi:hypothetical protein